MSKKLSRDIIICPNCKSEELKHASSLQCLNCKVDYPIVDERIHFVAFNEDNVEDDIDRLKFLIKRNPKLYGFITDLLSPVYRTDKILSNLIKEVEKKKNIVAVNLGSGYSDLSPNITNMDMFAYENVDIACDISKIPLRDNSVDYIFNIAVLEHVPNPELVVSEIQRVLKKGGVVYSRMPFMQGFHASPYDYSRRTEEGMRFLYKDFEPILLKPFGGPTSGLLWVLQEWLALVFSFGIKKLHNILYLVVLVLTFPLKLLDVLLIHHPKASHISSAFIFVGKKR